jgi:hypothetical protein
VRLRRVAVPSLDRIGMLVLHAYVDRRTNELRASVTFAGDLTDGEERTQIARSPEEVLALVRAWLDLGNTDGDDPVTRPSEDRKR